MDRYGMASLPGDRGPSHHTILVRQPLSQATKSRIRRGARPPEPGQATDGQVELLTEIGCQTGPEASQPCFQGIGLVAVFSEPSSTDSRE